MVLKPLKPKMKPELQEFDDEEEYESQEEPDESELPPMPSPKKKEPAKESEITIDQVLINHESRLKELEASLYRLRNI